MKSNEFKRWLIKQGVILKPTKNGSHFKAFLNGKQSIFPYHCAKEMKKGTVIAIKKQLGLK